jgi:hypothetical protein
VPSETYRTLPVRNRQGEVIAAALVDAEDFDWASKYPWHIHRKEGRYARTVVREDESRRHVFLHRAVLGFRHRDNRRIDHINGDRLDCRKANLRLASVAQNAQNQGSRGGSSRFRGVTWDRSRQKWLAQAVVAGERHHLGRFDSELGAAAAAARFRAEHMPYSQEARLAAA